MFRKQTNRTYIVLHNTTTLFEPGKHDGLQLDRLSEKEYTDRLAAKASNEEKTLNPIRHNTFKKN